MSTPTPLEQWSMILPHIPTHTLMKFGNDTLMERFLAGNAEHGGDWLSQPPAWFTQMIREEQMDEALYRAMRDARFFQDVNASLWGDA